MRGPASSHSVAGAWNEKGFDFYDRLIDGLLERGIAPHLTLYHWDLPQALQESGGWVNRETVGRFVDYASEVARRFGSRAASIATHNEPWVVAVLGHEAGIFAPGLHSQKSAMQVAHHLLLSHGVALQALRVAALRCPLGIVLNQAPIHAATDSPEDLAKARLDDGLTIRWYMDALLRGRYPEDVLAFLGEDAPQVAPGDMEAIRQPLDFLGINYYTRNLSGTGAPLEPVASGREVTDMGWEVFPGGLTELLQRLDADYRCRRSTSWRTARPTAIASWTDASPTPLGSATCTCTLPRWRMRSRAGSTCAATSSGACSTTSSGPTAMPSASGWSTSTCDTAQDAEGQRALVPRVLFPGEGGRIAAGCRRRGGAMTGKGRRWKLVWSDEFDGGEIDATKWDFELGNGFFDYKTHQWVPGWGNEELQYYTRDPQNVSVRDSLLYIRALKEPLHGCGYTSARIRTRKRDGTPLFSKCYGKFEFRAGCRTARASGPRSGCCPRTTSTAHGRPPARST